MMVRRLLRFHSKRMALVTPKLKLVTTLVLFTFLTACGGQPTDDLEAEPAPGTPNAGPPRPVVNGLSPASPANNNNITVSGTAEANSTVNLYSNNTCSALVAQTTADGSGNWSFNLAVPDNTTNNYFAKATNANGSSFCSSTFVTFVEDSAAPNRPVMISTSPISPANNNAPIINGYAEPFSSVKIFSDSGCTTQIGSGTAASGATFAIAATISDDTSYNFYANATDASGNVGLCSTTALAFVEDSVAPALPTLTATAPVSPSNVNTPTVTGTGTANESIRLYSNATCTTQIGSGTIDGSGNYSVGVTLSNNATTQIYAKSSDAANNSNGCTTLFLTYVEDSTAPPLTISPIAPASPANNNNPVLAGTSEAAATVGLFSDATCTTSITSMAADGGGAFSFNLVVADNSTNNYYVQAQDAVGNKSACSAKIEYIEDSLAPALPTFTASSPTSPSSSNSPTITGGAEKSSTVNIYSDNSCTTLVTTTTANASNVFSFVTSVTADSSSSFWATATDLAGNLSACSTSTLTYVEDSTAPTMPTVASSTPTSPVNNNNPTINGTAEASSIVRLYSNSTCSTQIASGTADGGGAYALPITVADNSTTSIYARSFDLAGNSSSCSSTFITYTEDSLGPSPPVFLSVTPTSPANNNAPLVAGTTEANATVYLYSDNTCTTQIGTGTADGIGGFSIGITVADNTTTYIHGKVFDGIVYSGCSATPIQYIEDSMGPAAPTIVSSSPTSPYNSNTPTLSGTTEAFVAVSVYSDAGCSVLAGSTTANAGGNFSLNVSVSDNTTYNFYTKGTDVSANVGNCGVTPFQYIEDSTPPAAPTIISSSPISPSNSNTPSLTGTTEANATVSIYNDGACTIFNATGTADGSGNFSVNVTATSDITNNFYAKATDVANNAGACSATPFPYLEDSTGPATPSLISSTPVSPSSNNNPTLTGLSEANTNLNLYTDAGCTIFAASTTSDGAGNFSFNVTVGNDTTTNYYVQAFDGFGNPSACSSPAFVYVEDSTGPAAPAIASSSPLSPSNINTPNILGTTEANATVTLFSNASCTTQIGTGAADGSGNYSVVATVPADTTTQIYSRGTDALGNIGPCGTTPFPYLEDSTPPGMPTIVSSNPVSPANNNAPLLTGTAEANSNIVIYSDAGCTISAGTGTANGGGSFTISVSATNDITNNYYARATDLANNVGTCMSVPFAYIEDSTPPAAPAFTGTLPVSPSDNNTPTINGTAETSSNVKLFSNASCTTQVGTGTATGGVFGISISVSDKTINNIYGNATDAAGNVSSCSLTSQVYENYMIGEGSAYLYGTETTAPTTPTNINQATAYSMKWATSFFHSTYYAHSRTTNNHQLTVLQAGHYRVNLTIPHTGAVTRGSVRAQIRVNGVAINGGRGDSWIANVSAHEESSINIHSLLPNLAANDIIDVTVIADGGAGTITTYGRASMYVQRVTQPVFYATSTQTTNSTNLNQAIAYALRWTEVVNDTDYIHDDVTNSQNITINANGSFYLYLNIPLAGGAARTNVRAVIYKNGAPIVGGKAQQGFIRNTGGHTNSALYWAGILENLAVNDIITVYTSQEATTGTVTTTVGAPATILLENAGGNSGVVSVRGTALTTDANWNNATEQSVRWVTQALYDAAVFSHSTVTNPHQLTVQSAGDYVLLFNSSTTSTATISNYRVQVKVNGNVVIGANAMTNHIDTATSSGNNDASSSLAFYLYNLSANDVVTVTSVQEAAAGTITSDDDARLVLIKRTMATSP